MKTILSIITLFFLTLLPLSAQIDRSVQPKPGPFPKINIGKPQTFELENGLKVLVVENHKLPRVSATLTIDNDPIFEGDKAGVKSLTGSLLGTGTKNVSKDAFNEEVDYLGANIFFEGQKVTMKVLSKYFTRVLELMADASINPVFTQEELDKERDILLESIKANEKSVTFIANRVQSALAYGKDHPYGEFATKETVERVTLDDVQNFYDSYFKPNNAYLVIVGDIHFIEAKKLVKEHFSKWKKGTIPAYNIPVPQNVSTTEINFIDMPDAVQSNVAVLNTVDFKMGSSDYFAVKLANKILGDIGNGRLFLNLREDKAYTYNAYSTIYSDEKTAAIFIASTEVRNMVTDSSTVEMIKEIEKIRNTKVTEEELKNAKAAYVGHFVRNIEKPETVARYALNIRTNNLPENFYESYLENLNAVTVDDVQNVAQKYFKGDNSRVVITGKGIDVLPNLEKLPYNINYYDKEGNPTTKPKMPTAVSGDITPEIVLEKYFAARGGKDKLEAVNSMEQVYEMTTQGMSITRTMKVKKPNKIVEETSMMGQTMAKVVFDGNDGYMEQMGVKKPLPEEGKAEFASQKYLFEALGLAANDLSLDGIVPVNDKDAYKMIVTKEGGKEIKYFEVKSGLLVKEEKQVKGPDGTDTTIPTIFSDYKSVDGILFPHKIETKAMGQDMTLTLKKVEVNKEFPEGTFK